MENNSDRAEDLLETESLFGIDADDLENDTELVLDLETNAHENDADQMLEFEKNSNDNPTPATGMEFESYEDAYKYYNSYARELGFAIRVKSSWTKRNSKEKRGAVLCCNCEGFKTVKEASSRRKETRTGCLAMIRLRLVESEKWRVDEVNVEHNHPFDPERAQTSKSQKNADFLSKRKFDPSLDVEVRTIKLYRPAVTNSHDADNNSVRKSKRLSLNEGDAELISDYFCRVQLISPNFFYIMDFSDDGFLRNVFWVDSRARASYGYFGDVVAFDTTCLTNKYIVPVVVFVGVNHHGQTISLGYGLVSDESQETYTWLLRTWLSCMSGRPPQTVITDIGSALQSAITEIFPRAHHRVFTPLVVERVIENSGNSDAEGFQTVLNSVIYSSVKVDEFELAWDDMIRRFKLHENDWVQKLYEDRERWAPVYLKDTFFAGMFTFQPGESMVPFFHGYVHQQTSLKEFFDMHYLVSQNKVQKEAFDDCESRDHSTLKPRTTRTRYESQLSNVYTKQLFSLFQYEVEMISNCFNVSQVNTNGSIVTYTVTEQETDGNTVRNLEVLYDKIGIDVRCICSCFNFKGYLCRHALSVLNHNGVDEIPSQYILSRWRKDFKRVYVPDLGSDYVDITNPVQWFVHLHKRALQVVEEGMTSQEHYMVAWQAFKESLNKVRLVADKRTQN